MSDHDESRFDPVERVMAMVREYYADDEVMKAWSSADEEGQIPDEATQVIGNFKKRWRENDLIEGRLVFHASIAARQIAEGKFSSPDDPELRVWIEESRASIEKAAQ